MSFTKMDKYFTNYINAVTELNQLLGMCFIWDGIGYKSKGAGTLIGESVMMVNVYHNRGDYDNRNVEISKLMMLAKQLQTVRGYDKGLLNYFKKNLYATSKNV